MSKIIKDDKIGSIKEKRKVLIGGCFDILHPGHFEFIKQAKKQGDCLILLLESDKNIHKLKGKDHPLNGQVVRAKNLLANTAVDYVVLLKPTVSNDYYDNLVKSACPAIIAVTENDPLLEVKKKQARSVNGEVVIVMKRDTRYSTSSLLNKKI